MSEVEGKRELSPSQTHDFWKQAVVYQVYPRTFNEDTERTQTGQGSLRGITERLDYLKSLGVDAIWVSPFYVSPGRDGGYDIANMEAIDESYGSDADFDDLVCALHQRDMKIMIDLIPNHTSDQHEWFQSSRKRLDDKTDWYVWADAVPDETGELGPPNNWASVFSLPQLERRKKGELHLAPEENTPPKSAWTWDATRQQYYLHSFAEFQPDLNWTNSEVRMAIQSTMRTWLDRGVDGFRVDAVPYIGKNFHYDEHGKFYGPDEEYNAAYNEGVDNPYDQLMRLNSSGYPDVLHEYLGDIISVLEDPVYSKRDTRLLFEAYMPEYELKHIDQLAPSHATTFNFTPIEASWHMPTEVRKQILDNYHKHIVDTGTIANSVTGNHDKSRLVSRYGESIARSLALFTFLQPGMMFVYNGEELGRRDYHGIPLERLQDLQGLRDAERTPMPWSSQHNNDGFSDADPSELYLPLNPEDVCADIQAADDHSFLRYYQNLARWKRVIDGEYVPLSIETADGSDIGVLAYGRGDTHTVMTNFTETVQSVQSISPARAMGKIVLSSLSGLVSGTLQVCDTVTLQPNESILIEHKK